jgi:hypothetical protein
MSVKGDQVRLARYLRHIWVAAAAVALVAVAGASARPLDMGIRVSTIGDGVVTSTDSRIHCGAICSTRYRSDAVVTLTASPRRFFRFARWEGACVGTAPTCLVGA